MILGLITFSNRFHNAFNVNKDSLYVSKNLSLLVYNALNTEEAIGEKVLERVDG